MPMKKVYFFVSALLLFFLSSCSSLSEFYHSEFSEDYIFPEECLLKEGQEPQIFYSDNIANDSNSLNSKYYFVLGTCSYNGPADSSLKNEIRDLCIKKGAKLALYTYDYTDTRSGAYATSYGRNVYLHTYSIPRYDYYVVLFGSLPKALIDYYSIVGLYVSDLTYEKRQKSLCNVGAYISTVYENTPAYYANMVRGDVITEINDTSIASESDYWNFVDSLSDSIDQLKVTYVREGVEKTVTISLR